MRLTLEGSVESVHARSRRVLGGGEFRLTTTENTCVWTLRVGSRRALIVDRDGSEVVRVEVAAIRDKSGEIIGALSMLAGGVVSAITNSTRTLRIVGHAVGVDMTANLIRPHGANDASITLAGPDRHLPVPPLLVMAMVAQMTALDRIAT
jgi:hypothetical protein